MFLAIDASTKNISLAIQKKDKVVFRYDSLKPFGASDLAAVLDKALKKNKLKLKDFKAFIAGYGPGSFTGLRISYAMIKALTITLNKPAITVSSFYSVALPFFKAHKNIVIIADARKNLVYWVKFVNGKMQGKEKLSSLDAALAGNDNGFFITYDKNIRDLVLARNRKINFYSKDLYPSAANLIDRGVELYNDKKFTEVKKLEPLYLHPKDCQVRK